MTLEESYRFCRRVARQRARNFYYAFVLLSRAQRDAICAIYAFTRHCDDLSDDPALGGRVMLERWRVDLDAALDGSSGEHPVWPALQDAVRRYGIPRTYLHDMIDGVSSDLEPRRFETFDELYRYCYLVASVVGLTVVHIFGYRSDEALPLAEKCGVAFQLTNILRDVKEDAGRGRVYLPQEDLGRFGVSESQLSGGERTGEFVELMRFEAGRARSYYRESAPLVDLIEPASRPALRALIGIYSRLLDRIEGSNYDVLSRRISLPAWEKVWAVVRATV
jgi:phytoene synthase